MHIVDKHNALPPLTQEELSRLDTWLRDIKPDLSLFHVHGFLCAILTSPASIPTTEWFPIMLVPNLPDIMPEEEMQFYLDMVMQLKIELAKSLSHDELVYPMIDFRPMPPLSAYTLFQDQRPRLKEWCQGYLAGMTLRQESWNALQDFNNLALALQVVANETQAANIVNIANDPAIKPSQIQTLIHQMIYLLTNIPSCRTDKVYQALLP